MAAPSTNLPQHSRRCSVCKHPDRAAIEEAFLHWRSPYWIAGEFRLADRSSVYRHAHAFHLFAQRFTNLRSALEHIIEDAERVRPNALAVVEAVRLYAHLDGSGRWISPEAAPYVVPVPSARPVAGISEGPAEPLPIATPEETENGASC